MFKWKVPCDDLVRVSEIVDGLHSGDDAVNQRILEFYEEDPVFPTDLLKEGRLYFEFQMTDPVPLWCYSKTKEDSKRIVEFLASEMGENPRDVYHRWINKV